MGAYYGIINQTKGHRVSSYWKGRPPCTETTARIAQDLGWDLAKDKIISGSYEACYIFRSGEWRDRDDWSDSDEAEAQAPDTVVESRSFYFDGYTVFEDRFDGRFFFN